MKEGKLIGGKSVFSVSLTKQQLSILDLMALKHETTRSDMISRLSVLHADVDINICAVAERLTARYCDSNAPFETFLKSAKIWLEEKKISQYYISRIIQEVTKSYEAK